MRPPSYYLGDREVWLSGIDERRYTEDVAVQRTAEGHAGVAACSNGLNWAGKPDLMTGFAVHTCSCFWGSFDYSVGNYRNYPYSHPLCTHHRNSHCFVVVVVVWDDGKEEAGDSRCCLKSVL